MKVLVTGAAGSLGSAFINKLSQQQGVQVFGTDIKKPSTIQPNVVFTQFDIRKNEFLAWVEKIRPSVIVHLASILQISKALDRQAAYEIDVEATRRLLDKAVSIACDKFVVTTSGAAYGYYPRNLKNEISEDWSLMGNDDYFYSDHKRQVEDLMRETKLASPQLKQVIFRPGAILGPEFEGPVVDLFKQTFITGLLGYEGLFNFVWSEDVVDYLIEAVTTDITGEYNIAGEGALSMKQIAEVANKRYLSLPASLIQVALTVLKPLGLTQYGPEQVKFIKYRPVLCSKKIRNSFRHQPRYTSEQTLLIYLESLEAK